MECNHNERISHLIGKIIVAVAIIVDAIIIAQAIGGVLRKYP